MGNSAVLSPLRPPSSPTLYAVHPVHHSNLPSSPSTLLSPPTMSFTHSTPSTPPSTMSFTQSTPSTPPSTMSFTHSMPSTTLHLPSHLTFHPDHHSTPSTPSSNLHPPPLYALHPSTTLHPPPLYSLHLLHPST